MRIHPWRQVKMLRVSVNINLAKGDEKTAELLTNSLTNEFLWAVCKRAGVEPIFSIGGSMEGKRSCIEITPLHEMDLAKAAPSENSVENVEDLKKYKKIARDLLFWHSDLIVILRPAAQIAVS